MDIALKANSPNLSPGAAFALACGGLFLVSLDATIAVAAFPALREAFVDAGPETLSWVLNAYTIVYAALLAPAGRLTDLWGSRRIFGLGVSIFTLASAFCGLASTPEILIAARALQALGGALLTPASLALVLGAFPPEKRSAMVGAWSAVGALAAALGPTIGAALIAIAGWRFAFLANVPFGIWIIWVSARRLAENAPVTRERLDVTGIALLIVGMSLLTWSIVTLETGGTLGLSNALAAVSGLFVFGVFCVWSKDRHHAALDLKLFHEQSFSVVNVASFVFGIAFSLLFLASFLFLIQVWNFPPTLAGLAVAPGPLVVIPTAMALGRVMDRVGHRALLIGGGILFGVSQLTMYSLASESPQYWALLFPIQLVGGFSVGMILPTLSAAAVVRLRKERFGIGGAINNAVRQFGGVIGTAIAVLLLGDAASGLDAFQAAWVWLAGLTLLVSGIAAILPRHLDRQVEIAQGV